jgi:hypothetical protein
MESRHKIHQNLHFTGISAHNFDEAFEGRYLSDFFPKYHVLGPKLGRERNVYL